MADPHNHGAWPNQWRPPGGSNLDAQVQSGHVATWMPAEHLASVDDEG